MTNRQLQTSDFHDHDQRAGWLELKLWAKLEGNNYLLQNYWSRETTRTKNKQKKEQEVLLAIGVCLQSARQRAQYEIT